jgi:hypothetical protein
MLPVALSLGSCSCPSDEDNVAADGAVSGSGGGSTGGPSGTGGSGASGGSGGTAGEAVGGACGTLEAYASPVDMLFMVDQAVSMADPAGAQSKWELATAAIAALLEDPGSAGMSAGIQYFGLPDTAPGDSCDEATYADAAVPIAPLPGNAQAIIDSMAQHAPSTGAPLSAALQGALDFCKEWQNERLGHQVVHVFVTDGERTECETDVAAIAAIADNGVSTDPSIPTFVLGVGSDVDTLEDLASAGGAGGPYLLDQDANAAGALLAALQNMRSTALPCTLLLPPPMEGTALDFTEAEVQYIPGAGGMPVTFEHVGSAAECPPGGGWHYDDNGAPKDLVLCAGACQIITSDPGAELTVAIGCLE